MECGFIFVIIILATMVSFGELCIQHVEIRRTLVKLYVSFCTFSSKLLNVLQEIDFEDVKHDNE